MRLIRRIIIHCSDSPFGDVREIDRWHREKGWTMVGYHYVVLNGHRTARSEYSTEVDGLLETGRPAAMVGAHCKGHNSDSLGICLVGKTEFTKVQREKLRQLLNALMREHGLGPKDVYGHYEFEPGKTCPNMDMDLVRAGLLGNEHPITEEYRG